MFNQTQKMSIFLCIVTGFDYFCSKTKSNVIKEYFRRLCDFRL